MYQISLVAAVKSDWQAISDWWSGFIANITSAACSHQFYFHFKGRCFSDLIFEATNDPKVVKTEKTDRPSNFRKSQTQLPAMNFGLKPRLVGLTC